MASDTATDLRVERKPKLSETVVAAIRKQLQAGEILPGNKLPTEGQLTETFGVSRTVIREALANAGVGTGDKDALAGEAEGGEVGLRRHSR